MTVLALMYMRRIHRGHAVWIDMFCDCVRCGDDRRGPEGPAMTHGLKPTFRKRGSEVPDGWVMMDGMRPKAVRRITEGYLNQRMLGINTVGMNQGYVSKVLDNPRTPEENRIAVIGYVLDHPERFTPVSDSTGDPEADGWARRGNGDARRGFMRDFRMRYSV